MKINVFWFRRDLRIDDNTALWEALNSDLPVLPVFIFDTNITNELFPEDPRIQFIYCKIAEIDKLFKRYGSSLKIFQCTPKEAFEQILNEFEIQNVYINRDYEPYANQRDFDIKFFLKKRDVSLVDFKDQVIFEKDEILKANAEPYTVFTPYKNQWLNKFKSTSICLKSVDLILQNLVKIQLLLPNQAEFCFKSSSINVKEFDLSKIDNYKENRDFPAIDGTTNLGVHLRYGTLSIRKIIKELNDQNEVFLSELIWREFFMQILAHYPRVVNENFKIKYDNILWRNDIGEFERWCIGQTGYPLVDAGMRQLNQTGYMHNRVRMVAASFLCKHLLVDWRWGEAYFAGQLLDYELSSNNGNWQWAAGTGCDAAPYFRIFNPIIQQKKFDPEMIYIKQWIPEFGSTNYPRPMVEHEFARQRAINTYKFGLGNS